MKRVLTGSNQFENPVKTPIAAWNFECSSGVQPERSKTSDEGQVQVLIPLVIRNIYECRISIPADHLFSFRDDAGIFRRFGHAEFHHFVFFGRNLDRFTRDRIAPAPRHAHQTANTRYRKYAGLLGTLGHF
jgi:hypothetical protein